MNTPKQATFILKLYSPLVHRSISCGYPILRSTENGAILSRIIWVLRLNILFKVYYIHKSCKYKFACKLSPVLISF